MDRILLILTPVLVTSNFTACVYPTHWFFRGINTTAGFPALETLVDYICGGMSYSHSYDLPSSNLIELNYISFLRVDTDKGELLLPVEDSCNSNISA